MLVDQLWTQIRSDELERGLWADCNIYKLFPGPAATWYDLSSGSVLRLVTNLFSEKAAVAVAVVVAVVVAAMAPRLSES